MKTSFPLHQIIKYFIQNTRFPIYFKCQTGCGSYSSLGGKSPLRKDSLGDVKRDVMTLNPPCKSCMTFNNVNGQKRLYREACKTEFHSSMKLSWVSSIKDCSVCHSTNTYLLNWWLPRLVVDVCPTNMRVFFLTTIAQQSQVISLITYSFWIGEISAVILIIKVKKNYTTIVARYGGCIGP